jgi:transaldolase
VPQAILAAKAGATIISPFVGRLDDIGENGMDLIGDIMEAWLNYGFETQVLVASVRDQHHIVEAARLGAHIATIPYAVFQKMPQHDLTDAGIKKFLADWDSIKK